MQNDYTVGMNDTITRGISSSLLTLALIACAEKEPPASVAVEFIATYLGEPVSCAAPLDESTRLTDLRLYVSGVEQRDSDGRWRAAGENPVTLIDFEDGSGACQNGTAAVATRVESVRADTDGLRFEVGVPFELNHADPLQATFPLNQPVMHWHWRSGYKFLRVGVEKNGIRWHVHLGSTGCEGPMTAVSRCAAPNRALVTLADWVPGDKIEVKLDALLAGVTIDDSARHCLAATSNPACIAIARNLGLKPETGLPGDNQNVFHIRRLP